MRLFFTAIFSLTTFLIQAQNSSYDPLVIENYEAGTKAVSNGELKQATDLFKKCISIDSTCYEAFLNLSLIAFENRNYAKSLTYSHYAKGLRPFDPVLISLMGRIQFQQGNYANAENNLRTALQIGGEKQTNKQYLALALQRQENYEEAFIYFNELIDEIPNDYFSWLNRGALFTEMEMYNKGLRDLNHALELSPKSTKIHEQTAVCYLALGKLDSAILFIDYGLQNAPANELLNFHLLKGNYFRIREDYKSAALSLENAYNMEQKNPLILMHQAAVLIDLEKYDAAIEKCNATIEIDPEQMEAYFNRGIANEMIRSIEEACNDWEKAFLLGSQKAIEYLNSPVCNE